jgi:3-oxoacyl-(acyl-carrier-protein) synthase/pimeloyl-ACP methyl ester carboxylesterase
MNEDNVVIVGMSCRLPEIDSPSDFWKRLMSSTTVLSKSNRYNQQYAGGFIDKIDRFDAAFFNISPREAMLTDPQIRILLEEIHHAIEDSNLTIKELRKLNCGVFVTSLPGDYRHLISKNAESNGTHFGFSGNSFSALSGRVSFFYDLNGPSISLDTACSSGLHTMQIASLNLQTKQCDAAVVGGITIFSTDEIFTLLNNAMIYSKSGTCLPFSQKADGLVPAEACVCFVLMRKSTAIELDVPIYAEIESIKVNHDGNEKGFMCPNAKSQANLLREVYSNIDPNQLACIETHGTGTLIGDETELRSLQMGLQDKLRVSVMLGASKFTVGHSLVTSSLVSVMKAILCLKNNMIPSVHHLKNENIDGRSSQRFRFNTTSENIDELHSLIAVNAFGFSGSNGHIVLKRSAKKYVSNTTKSEAMIFPISAKSKWSLIEILRHVREFIDQDCKIDQLESVLCNGLNSFRIRIAFIAYDVSSLCKELNDFLQKSEKSIKIENQIIELPEFPLEENKRRMLQNWIHSGDESLFSSYRRKFDENAYKMKYPFNEQSFWIDETVDKVQTPSKEIFSGFLSEYLSIDNAVFSDQIVWLKTKKKKKHILLLPPLNGNYKMWFFQIRKFTQEGLQLHIPFYPYHGNLSKKPSSVDFEKLIEEIYQYVIELKKNVECESVSVVGWSIGGCFATLLCLKHPSVVNNLCLISTAANFDTDVFEKTLDIQDELNKRLDLLQIIYEKRDTVNELLSAGTNMLSLKSFYDFLSKFDVVQASNRLSVPCLIIHGGKDVVISREKLNELSEILGAEKVVLPNDGHFIPLTNPKIFNDIVLSFIKRDEVNL